MLHFLTARAERTDQTMPRARLRHKQLRQSNSRLNKDCMWEGTPRAQRGPNCTPSSFHGCYRNAAALARTLNPLKM
eukprot:4129684-Pyramimonas_sp.AAC.2